MPRHIIYLYFLIFLPVCVIQAQETAFGNQTLDEFLRRKLLTGTITNSTGWMLRTASGSVEDLFYQRDSLSPKKKLFDFYILPLYSSSRLDGKRPYVGGEYGMIPARGAQLFVSTGFQARFSILHFQFQPELVSTQNLPFPGFPNTYSSGTIGARFSYWNSGDSPERFGNASYTRAFWGQSSISLRAGAFEFGVGTKNFWWGPGQWNSLIFSNNAPGFPHISLNTTKPAKTFLGQFEGQVLIGRLESSNQTPTQIDDLNSTFFSPLNPDWRYLNALMLSYSPKWIPSLTVGYTRTYQYYNETRPDDLKGWLPILEPMAKEKLFKNGNSVEYDDRAQSQQISIFGRYKMTKAKAEVYFQFGRRDHALNWREFIMTPEHARAYQVGFIKLTNLSGTDKFLQIRGEITHQQESVNRYLRYDLNGGNTWHNHGRVRGFTNYGQPMGVGIGTGSNVQTLEVSLVEDWNKLGILFERLENNQDFYYRAFGQQGERKPWIDWSTALLWNTNYKDLFISARLQGTYARNYQWGLSETSTPEFPVSQNLLSLHSQVNLIYLWNRSLKKQE
uniref:capsule assembly Wzi family protein n=1 Tax=Algoriphagus sp. TaxID=1872435 RepID=UPI00404800AD